ncbi:DUF3100 domain-containing protein, partial [Pseudomonas syringae pv. tagetis]
TKASKSDEGLRHSDVSLEVTQLGWSGKISPWLAAGALAFIANYVGYKTLSADAITGMGIMIFCAFLGEALCKLIRRKIPAVCMVSLVAMFLTS